MSLSKAQRNVALGMAAGLALSVAGLAASVLFWPSASLPDLAGRRLQMFAFAALAPAVALAFCIARLAAYRFHTPADLDGSGLTEGTSQAKLLQAVLQNTLEQLALAIPVYAAWAALASGRLLPALFAAAAMFLLGRVLFFWGYGRGAPGRALGFVLTFYPTVLLLLGELVLNAHFAAS